MPETKVTPDALRALANAIEVTNALPPVSPISQAVVMLRSASAVAEEAVDALRG